ncbi:MAG: hypothetical protein AABZ60_16715 [Planctomycetota bacterium]
MKCSECPFFNGKDCDQLPGELDDPVCLQRVLIYSSLRQENRLRQLEMGFHQMSPPRLPPEMHRKMQKYIEQALAELDESEQWKNTSEDEPEEDSPF